MLWRFRRNADWYSYIALIDTHAICDARINEVNSRLTNKFQGLDIRRVVLEGDAAGLITNYARVSTPSI